MNNVFLYRMPVGIAGAVSRPQDLTVEPVVLKSDNAFAAYGLAGKYDDDGFFVPLADGDTADKVKGIYVRPYPTTSQPDMVRQVGSGKNFPGDAMKRGYVTVNLGSDFDASTIKKGDPVYVVVSTDESIKVPLGGFMATSVSGKNWVGKDSTAIAGVNVDTGKSGNPLNLWGMELGWTVIELQAAQQVGRPIDTQKYDGMQLKWQMDNDEQVYVGDSALNLKGLVTLDGVPVNNAAKTWATSTPDEIRASINQVLSDAWAASGYSVVPRDLLIPPEQFALLSSIIVSSAGNQSLLTYLQTNTISYHQNGVPLNIRAVKWLKGRGVGNKDRMVAYTNDKKYVRYPLVPLQSVPVQYRGLYQIVTYYGKLGAVEPVYKETISYVDGI